MKWWTLWTSGLALRHCAPRFRLRACRRLAKLGSPAFKLLCFALNDSEPVVRDVAIDGLREIANHSTTQQLLVYLDGPQSKLNEIAERILKKRGATEVECLVAGVKHAKHRDRIFFVLASIRDPRTVRALIEAIEIACDDRVVDAVVDALVAIGNPRAIEPLLRTPRLSMSSRVEALESFGAAGVQPLISLLANTGDKSSFETKYAAEALGRLGDTRAVEPLLRAGLYGALSNSTALDAVRKIDSKPKTRQEEIIRAVLSHQWSTAASFGRDAVQPLLAVVRDYPEAATALATIGDPAAIPALIQELWEVGAKPQIVEALVTFGDSVVKSMISSLNGANLYERRAADRFVPGALRIVQRCRTTKALGELLTTAKSAKVRLEVVIALHHLAEKGDADALAALADGIAADDAVIRDRSLWSLKTIKIYHAEHYPVVRERVLARLPYALRNEDSNPWEILEFLQNIDFRPVCRHVLEWAQRSQHSSDENLRCYAIGLLEVNAGAGFAEFRDQILQPLRKSLNDPIAHVRAAACRALGAFADVDSLRDLKRCALNVDTAAGALKGIEAIIFPRLNTIQSDVLRDLASLRNIPYHHTISTMSDVGGGTEPVREYYEQETRYSSRIHELSTEELVRRERAGDAS